MTIKNRFASFTENETYCLEIALNQMLKKNKKIDKINRNHEGIQIITQLLEEVGMQNEIIPESIKKNTMYDLQELMLKDFRKRINNKRNFIFYLDVKK